MKTLALTLVVGAVVALGYAEVMPLIESPVLSLDSAVSVLLVVVVAVLGFYVLRPVVAQRPPEIRSGVLSLEYPIPRTNGSRTRTVALDEVAEVEPAIEGGHPGLRIKLKDGSSSFLDWFAFGERGVEILETLGTSFGVSFFEGYRQILLDGSKHRFQSARVSEMHGGRISLSPPVRTNERTSRLRRSRARWIEPARVKSIEWVSPRYTGRSLLVTLVDWTLFLISEADVTALALLDNPTWRSKFVGPLSKAEHASAQS